MAREVREDGGEERERVSRWGEEKEEGERPRQRETKKGGKDDGEKQQNKSRTKETRSETKKRHFAVAGVRKSHRIGWFGLCLA